ncbi:MAG: hypothetical protein ABI130_13375 [Leifsonia sp.]
MRATRIGLVALGIALLVLGASVMQSTVSTQHIVGLIVWLVCALIVHDGIIAPIVFGVGLGMRRSGKSIPFAVLAILQGGVVVGLIVSLVVIPEIYAKHLGTANPTVLPFDYAMRLLFLWGGVLVATALTVAVYYVAARRLKNRSSASQD